MATMTTPSIRGFRGKRELVNSFAVDKTVLHLGAVGETCMDTETRVERARFSTHADLTGIASRCVGIDHDEASVDLLTRRGIFDNLIHADATTLVREDIPLDSIDVIVAGDIIEHLSEPGRLLEVVDRLSDPSTRLVLTTLNALGLGIFVRNALGRPIESPDHSCSFNWYTLSNLIKRYGWRVDEMWTCHQPKAEELNPRIFRVGKAVLERVPQFGGTLLFVCTRPDGEAHRE